MAPNKIERQRLARTFHIFVPALLAIPGFQPGSSTESIGSTGDGSGACFVAVDLDAFLFASVHGVTLFPTTFASGAVGSASVLGGPPAVGSIRFIWETTDSNPIV